MVLFTCIYLVRRIVMLRSEYTRLCYCSCSCNGHRLEVRPSRASVEIEYATY